MGIMQLKNLHCEMFSIKVIAVKNLVWIRLFTIDLWNQLENYLLEKTANET